MLRVVPFVGTVLLAVISADPGAAGLRVTEQIKTYSVTGSTIQAVVRSMKRNGPFSENHGRRALGLADFRYRTRLKTEQRKGRCHVRGADVTMRIWYIVPGLSSRARLSKRDAARWQRIRSMITAHERQHARLYRRFGKELAGALQKLKPAANCAQLTRQERLLRRRFEQRNMRRNRRFDRAQYGPFNARLRRLAPK